MSAPTGIDGPPAGARSTAVPAQALVGGVVVALSPLVCRLVAPNPSPMTGSGTNSYLVGDPMQGPLVAVDPGPDDEDHLDRLAAASAGRLEVIAVTHHHPDHWPGARGLQARTGAEIVAFGHPDGIQPDRVVRDGDVVAEGATDAGDTWQLSAVHTPGHASDHLCFALWPDGWLFSGDHVMDGSTVVIRPPDGDLDDYVAQLARLRAMGLSAIAPGHGSVIEDPDGRVDALLEHRGLRTAQVRRIVEQGGDWTASAVAAAAYPGLDVRLIDVSTATTWAALRSLAASGAVAATDPDDPDSPFRAV